MFKKSMLLSSLLICSVSAHAGFFGGDDFKCGREDAVKALQDSIKSAAAGVLQSEFITNPSIFYGKNLEEFQSKLDHFSVDVSNVSTSDKTESVLSCRANIAFKLPAETLDVLRDVPGYLSGLVSNGGKLSTGGIVWSNHPYNLKLADNKKDISVTDLGFIPRSLFQADILSVTKNDVINNNFDEKIRKEKISYASADAWLNRVWKNLPDSIKRSMKKEQVSWVNQKAVKCGNLTDADSSVTPAPQRVAIYKCQSTMTQERISFLGGDREE